MFGRIWATAVLLATAFGFAAATAGPAAAEVMPPGQFLDVNAKPVLSWSVPSRYASGWTAYQTSERAYADYAHPKNWSVILDACASTSLYRITGYTFTLSGSKSPGWDSPVGQTTSWTKTAATTSCRLTLNNILPWQGEYQASLKLQTSLGGAGVSAAVTKPVTIRDIVVVSLGDSFASGEGVPDVAISSTSPQASWKDRRCHRSARSGPALAAERLEAASSQTSITFLSVACSGATLANLINEPYAGMEPVGTEKVLPQVDKVASLIGPNTRWGGRTIDHLLVTAGLNDLGFSTIIKVCAMYECYFKEPTPSEPPAGVIIRGMDNLVTTTLAQRYTALDRALATKLPRIREVHLSDYPGAVFVGGAKVGVLSGDLSGKLPWGTWADWDGKGISAAEGQRMIELGNRFTEAIFKAAADHGWNRLGSGTSTLTQIFYAHSYGSAQSWFNTYEQSQSQQGNEAGTAHPNRSGHTRYGSSLFGAISAHTS